MKKNNKSNFIMVLFFFIGLTILFYPAVSNYTNEKLQSKAVSKYEDMIKNIKKKDYTEYFKKAEEYNKKLMKLNNPLVHYKKLGDASKILNINNSTLGMIGYISINKIKVELPIYYGNTPEILNTSVGLMEGTSFPIGGKGTHSVLAAHRGLPSSKLFTDLDDLEVGDTFVITILDQKYTYQVDQIKVVKPTELNAIKIDKKQDYVTLMTCTPYGINSHRLLVRGHRVENGKIEKFVSTEAFKINKLVVTPLVCMPILFGWLLFIAFAPVNNDNNNDFTNQFVYPTEFENKEKKEKKIKDSYRKERLK